MKVNTLAITVLCLTLCGCKTPQQTDALVGLIVQNAACGVAAQKPLSATWIATAGHVFKAYGSSSVPTPAEMQEALVAIPLGSLTPGQRALLITDAIAAYSAVWSLATPDRAVRIQSLLTAIGNALEAGSECASLSKSNLRPTETDMKPVIDAITQALKKG